MALSAPQALAGLPGADAQLTRAPYLTDLTANTVQVSWATTTQSKGIVKYGPVGSCAAKSVTSTTLGSPITVNNLRQYNNSVALTGLLAGTAYCYRVFTGGTTPVDLLGSVPTPQFTTLGIPTSTSSLTFAVFGDWGDTTNNGVNNGSINADQAALHARIRESGARFAISTGDVGYPSGTQTNYGDLNQTGINISAVFSPQYWAWPGQSIPMYAASGNHGRNSTFLSIWPEQRVAAPPNGNFSMVHYDSINGTTPADYPTPYYAFSTNGVRFYVLDVAWSDGNVGAATGGACGSRCKAYEIERAAHWTTSSAQYQWLANDLATHPGGVKLAFFHYPLRSDSATEVGDTFLQNIDGTSPTLEKLLVDNGVGLAFNGHSHIYQRNTPPAGQLKSYVTGGGGAKVAPVGGGPGCKPTTAYAIGWSYSSNHGSKCGSATAPASDSQVYHFLKVTVTAMGATTRRVKVTPTDSLGGIFDEQTYTLG